MVAFNPCMRHVPSASSRTLAHLALHHVHPPVRPRPFSTRIVVFCAAGDMNRCVLRSGGLEPLCFAQRGTLTVVFCAAGDMNPDAFLRQAREFDKARFAPLSESWIRVMDPSYGSESWIRVMDPSHGPSHGSESWIPARRAACGAWPVPRGVAAAVFDLQGGCGPERGLGCGMRGCRACGRTRDARPRPRRRRRTAPHQSRRRGPSASRSAPPPAR